jgi:hypothetical protein
MLSSLPCYAKPPDFVYISNMAPPECTVRVATSSDIPALLSLLLTSFRQFTLFDVLYSPIHVDIDYARDTVFFWRRRLILDLLNPRCTVLVAEQPVSQQPQSVPENVQSSQMLAWMEKQGLRQESGASRIMGFAIWKIRGIGREDGSDVMSWMSWSRSKHI